MCLSGEHIPCSFFYVLLSFVEMLLIIKKPTKLYTDDQTQPLCGIKASMKIRTWFRDLALYRSTIQCWLSLRLLIEMHDIFHQWHHENPFVLCHLVLLLFFSIPLLAWSLTNFDIIQWNLDLSKFSANPKSLLSLSGFCLFWRKLTRYQKYCADNKLA